MRLFYLPSADRWACLAKVLSISRKAKVNTVSKFSSLGSKSLQGEKKRDQSLYNGFPPSSLSLQRAEIPYNGPPRFAFQMLFSLCNYMDQSPPGSFVHRILQVRLLEWVVISSSRESSWPRHPTHISFKSPALAGGFFTTRASWEAFQMLKIHILINQIEKESGPGISSKNNKIIA